MNAILQATVCKPVLTVWEVTTVHVTSCSKLILVTGGSVLVSNSLLER